MNTARLGAPEREASRQKRFECLFVVPIRRDPVDCIRIYGALIFETIPDASLVVGKRADEREPLGLDLDPIRSQPFVKLSGGQKQKVLIALALREHADLLVMDEPAANLDPAARERFFGLLRERGRQRTMLISIHRLDDVAGLATRVVELDQGRVSEDRKLGEAADARA